MFDLPSLENVIKVVVDENTIVSDAHAAADLLGSAQGRGVGTLAWTTLRSGARVPPQFAAVAASKGVWNQGAASCLNFRGFSPILSLFNSQLVIHDA